MSAEGDRMRQILAEAETIARERFGNLTVEWAPSVVASIAQSMVLLEVNKAGPASEDDRHS